MSIYPNTLEPIFGPSYHNLREELEDKFPPVNPHPSEELGAIMYKAGQRSVVEWLINRIEEGDNG